MITINNTTVNNRDIVITMAGLTNPYISRGGTSYVVIAYMHYNGSIEEGIIEEIKCIATMNGTTDTGSIKIYDSTNSLTIAENVNGVSGTSPAIYDLGTISNVPETPAIFEIQVKVSNTADNFQLSSMRFLK